MDVAHYIASQIIHEVMEVVMMSPVGLSSKQHSSNTTISTTINTVVEVLVLKEEQVLVELAIRFHLLCHFGNLLTFYK